MYLLREGDFGVMVRFFSGVFPRVFHRWRIYILEHATPVTHTRLSVFRWAFELHEIASAKRPLLCKVRHFSGLQASPVITGRSG